MKSSIKIKKNEFEIMKLKTLLFAHSFGLVDRNAEMNKKHLESLTNVF